MMEATGAGEGDDLSKLTWLNPPTVGEILPKGKMPSILVVPGDEFSEDSFRVGLVPDDHVVEALSAEGPDHSLRPSVHLGGADGHADFLGAETADAIRELMIEGRVAIPNY